MEDSSHGEAATRHAAQMRYLDYASGSLPLTAQDCRNRRISNASAAEAFEKSAIQAALDANDCHREQRRRH